MGVLVVGRTFGLCRLPVATHQGEEAGEVRAAHEPCGPCSLSPVLGAL
jgi:hypothetical protein